MELTKKFDEALEGVEESAKEKIREAAEDAIKAKVKKELRKRRKKFVRRVIFLGAAAAVCYLVWTYRDDITDFAEDKAKEVKRALK